MASSWLASWLRHEEISEHERTSVEMRCLSTCLHLCRTYDQLNSPRLSSTETFAWWTAQIAEAYPGEGDKPRWTRVQHYKRRTRAPVCIDRDLRAAVVKKTREELDLEHLRGKFTGVTGTGRKSGATMSAGDGAGSGAMTMNQASGTGTTTGRIKSLKDGYGVVLDTIFPLPGSRVGTASAGAEAGARMDT